MSRNPIPRAAYDQHTLALGKTRSGKSSTLRVIVEDLLDHKKPVCIIDPKGDWWGLKSSADGKKAGYEVVIFGGAHADVPINEHSGKAVAELIATGNRPCIIDLGGWMVGARTRFFVDFAATLFVKTHGHRWLVIDEVHNFAPQGKVLDPDAGKMLHWANRLASEGAGKGITLISASQRPQKVHKDYVTSHETLIAKRVIHPLDRNAIKEWIDGCGDPSKGKAVLESLAGLNRSEGWVWSPEIDFGPKLIGFPMFSTYDSFAVQTRTADKKLKGWAAVDLDEIKTKLAAVIEKEKAKDPKALQDALAVKDKEIARLTGELTFKSTAAPAAPDRDTIRAAEERGFEQAKKKLAKAAEKAVRDAQKNVIEVLRERLSPLGAFLKALDGQFTSELATIKSAEINLAKDVTYTPAPAAAVPRPVSTVPPRSPSPAKPATPNGNSGNIDRPLQLIINAIRWWNVMGLDAPSHAQVAFIAGYSHKSGTWARYLSSLRSAGLIEGRGDLVITADGALVVQDPGTPPTGEQLRAAVLDKIDGPLIKIMQPILEAYPLALSHEEAGEKAGYSHASGTWARYLSSLRSLDLIHKSGPLKAQDWLFPMARAA